MRTTSHLKLLGSVLLAGAAIYPLAAAAQSSSGSIEEVVVTAEKRSEAVKNVPMSITVVGQDQLDNLNIRSFADLMTQVPGLSVSEADPTHPVLSLRGINAGGDGSTVGTYLDETPYGSSNALANGVDTAPNLDTFDMQRIEVLRGPQGTLYGAGAEGGLLKFVTNAPDTTGFDDAVELTGVNMDHGGFGESERGMVNIALTDDLAVRVVGFDVRTPGYIKNPTLDLQHANDVTNFGGRAAVLWRPTDKISVRLNVVQQQLDAGNDDAEDVAISNDRIAGPLFGDYTQMRNITSPAEVRYYLYNATINWDLDFATITSSTSYTDLRSSEIGDTTGAASTLDNPLQAFLHQGKLIQELRVASDPGQGPLDWMVGFYFANEHDGLHQDVVPSFHGSPLLSLDLDSTYVETTGFANATYHVTSNFELGAGLRYATDSQSSDEIEQIQLLSVPPTLIAGGTSAHDSLTWSGDARYHLDENTMLYGRVATGWRPGGPNVLPPNPPAGVPTTFNPDSLIDYELGVKSTLPNENLSFDADLYDIEWQDIQLLEVVDGYGINGNGGRANSKGVEANVTWLPLDRLTLNLNGAFADAQLSNDAPVVGGLKGNALPYSPKWSGTLNGDYTFLPVGDFTPYVGASWHYIGVKGWGFNSGLAEGNLPDYNTLDLRVGVEWQKWTVELYGKNLNDAKGISAFTAAGTSAASAEAPFATIIQPRIIGLVLRGKF
jgi:outer membrane receptor protein involved in Fe transport